MNIVRTEDWPHGLRCGQCHTEIIEGERFSTLLQAFAGDVPITLVVCVPCAYLRIREGDVS